MVNHIAEQPEYIWYLGKTRTELQLPDITPDVSTYYSGYYLVIK